MIEIVHDWKYVIELFKRHGIPEPPTRIRDEIVALYRHRKEAADALSTKEAECGELRRRNALLTIEHAQYQKLNDALQEQVRGMREALMKTERAHFHAETCATQLFPHRDPPCDCGHDLVKAALTTGGEGDTNG